MTAIMKGWAAEVKKSAKELIVGIMKDTVLLCVVKTIEGFALKSEKAIRRICRRNDWEPEDYIPAF
jgi:hypothetical protein